MTVSIRRPVAERVDHTRVRTPDPTVFTRVAPFAVTIEIFCAPNVFVVVLVCLSEPLREITLAIADPLVNRVTWSGGEEVPIAGVLAGRDDFRSASVAQRKS